MSKLPKIYHKNEKIVSNNKYSYISYEKKINNVTNKNKEEKTEINYLTLFNKNVEITLNDGSILHSSIISKYNNNILLIDGRRINIDEIQEIKKLL